MVTIMPELLEKFLQPLIPESTATTGPVTSILFISNAFGIHFLPGLLSPTLLSSLVQVVRNTESNYTTQNIRENLVDSDEAIW